MELGSHTELERDGAGLSYKIGKRWSWALIQNWKEMELGSHTELERDGAGLSQNWKEMELGSHTELERDGAGLSYRIGGR